jgi:membrane fusion protein, adhesin transport system
MKLISHAPKTDAVQQGYRQWLILGSAFAVVALIAWAAFAEIDQITRASGTVIPSSRNQIIQVMEQAMVDDILVREGDVVRRGQVLMRFDKVRTEAAYQENKGKFVALKATVARLTAEILGQQPVFPSDVVAYPELLSNQRALFQKRQSALHEDLDALNKAFHLLKSELDLMQPLIATGDVSKVEILRLQRQLADLQGKIATRKNKYLEDTQADLSKAQESMEALSQQLAQHRKLVENAEIVAPMDGVVRNIRITTKGGVARPGEEVMQIVPVDDELLVEAKVKPLDIAFVKVGLPATVKFDAWDYTIYGSFSGTVTYISADTLRDETQSRSAPDETYYRVQVKLAGKELTGQGPKPVRLQPGMTATVEIQTGKNTVLNFLTKPITKTLNESMGER